ncbi:MAG: DUF3800 domain-containing protein [Chloroflexota bacterium]|nr:MAG: hypothetical protein DLM70_13990 [Chloroflexota bacterium]
MRIYVDDSGDPGMRLGKRGGRSSPYRCIAAVLVNDYLALEEAVRDFREDRAWTVWQEIKFEDTRDANARRFFSAMMNLPLKVHSLVIVKAHIAIPYAEIKPNLYQFAVRRVLREALVGQFANLVIIDEVGQDKKAKQRFITDLRNHLNSDSASGARVVREVAVRDSKHEDGLQVADMMAGAVAFRHKYGNPCYSNLIQPVLREHT